MPTNLRIETTQLTDQNLMSVAWLVSRFPPFYGYSFGLMLEKLHEQLRSRSNVTISLDGQLVAYAGWFAADASAAKEWQIKGLDALPLPLEGGDAIIVTIVVTHKPEYLRPLIKAISHVCAGKKVYRKRTFTDQRADMNRPPITGRIHSVI
jgi:hypothetical protein